MEATPITTASPATRPAPGGHRRHTILVVDDEPDVVKSVQDLLRYDYKVLGATRASEALKLLEQNQVHVIMSDQRMPEMSGVEFLAHARNDHPEAIRLLFTGYADIRAVIDAINEGRVYRYITKPWDPDELQTIIREAVERYELIEERRRLIEELKETNVELERANQQLREADILKTNFIQVASHELRTPLAILTGLLDLTARVPDVKPPLSNWLNQIRSANGRLSSLVNQLVTMLSAGRYQVPLAKAPAEVSAVLNDAANDIQAFVDLRKQKLVRDYPADLGQFTMDGGKIRDTLNHLLLNAVKFTPDGGTITLRATRDPQALRIEVQDTGIGMDEQCIARVGEAFFTGFDVSTHCSGQYEYGRKGLGLGLSVVKAFVEMHGGTLKVHSRAGAVANPGTTFTITLPQTPSPIP